jgi:hypothetical protein
MQKVAFVRYGSLNPLKGRTFRVVFRLTDGEEAHQKKTQPSRRYRNPLILAHEWQRALENGDCSSPAALARKLGFSRARVTQVLHLLSLAPEVQQQLMVLGDPLSSPLITERKLRPVVYLSPEEQQCWVTTVLRSSGKLR